MSPSPLERSDPSILKLFDFFQGKKLRGKSQAKILPLGKKKTNQP